MALKISGDSRDVFAGAITAVLGSRTISLSEHFAQLAAETIASSCLVVRGARKLVVRTLSSPERLERSFRASDWHYGSCDVFHATRVS